MKNNVVWMVVALLLLVGGYLYWKNSMSTKSDSMMQETQEVTTPDAKMMENESMESVPEANESMMKDESTTSLDTMTKENNAMMPEASASPEASGAMMEK